MSPEATSRLALASPKDTPAEAEDSLRLATDFVAACRTFLEKQETRNGT